MRIVAGRWGGRRLTTPKGLATRPTADRVREALFSILGDRVQDARVLDLFAGSGALGLEALSRGARSATFVESAPAALAALRANLAALGADAEVVRSDAPRWLRAASDGAREIGAALLEADPGLAQPEHALLEWAVRVAYGADALDPIPA